MRTTINTEDYIAISKFSKSPCYGCTTRAAGCHGSCERYFEWRDNKYEFQKAIQEQNRTKKFLRTDYYAAKEAARKRGL